MWDISLCERARRLARTAEALLENVKPARGDIGRRHRAFSGRFTGTSQKGEFQ
jgi:hypothetical protein